MTDSRHPGTNIVVATAVAAMVLAAGALSGGKVAANEPPPSPLPWFSARVLGVPQADVLLLATTRGVLRARIGSAAAPAGNTCFADDAHARVAWLLTGRLVRAAPQSRPRGEPRTYRIELPGGDLGRLLVSHGLAFARYRLDGGRRAAALQLAEESARTAGRGMWGACFRPDDIRVASVDRGRGRIRVAASVETRSLAFWRLQRPTSGRDFRLADRVVTPAQPVQVIADNTRPVRAGRVWQHAGRWSRHFREPLILSRADGTWASVWQGGHRPVRSEAPANGVFYAGRRDFGVLAGLGVNLVTLPYYPEIRRDLDAAYRRGLRVIVIGGDWIRGEGEEARVRPVLASRQIRQIRDHPALWGYYAVDEPAKRHVPLGVLRDLYSTIKLNDGLRPVLVVFDQVASFGSARNPYADGVADVVAFDIYSVSVHGYQPWIPYFLPGAARVVNDRTPGRPVWLVAQGFANGRLTTPSPSDLVRQVQEAVRHGGVEGTLTFLWDKTWDDRFPEFSSDLRSEPELQGALVRAFRILVRGAG